MINEDELIKPVDEKRVRSSMIGISEDEFVMTEAEEQKALDTFLTLHPVHAVSRDQTPRDAFFGTLAYSYETTGVIPDSIVRLDQEAAIARDVENGRPVLVRGTWRMGKTSMLFSLATHKVFQAPSLFMDVGGDVGLARASVDVFKKQFCVNKVAHFIAEQEFPDLVWNQQFDKEREIIQMIEQSGEPALEYLDRWLGEREQIVVIELDEILAFAGNKEMFQYIADVSKLKHLRVVSVIHMFDQHEGVVKECFGDYTEYFMRPLRIDETAALIQQKIPEGSCVLSAEAVRRVHEITGGRPIEVQVFMSSFFNPYRRTARAPQKIQYRERDITAFAGQDFFDLAYDGFQGIIDNYKRVYARVFSDGERVILDKLLRYGKLLPAEVAGEDMSRLISSTYVVQDADGGAYKINGKFFERWLREGKG